MKRKRRRKIRRKIKEKSGDVVKDEVEEDMPNEEVPEISDEKDLRSDKPKKKKKSKSDEKPVEDLASMKERLKPLKQDIVIMEIKPTKVTTIPVSDLPSFATLKLKKAPKRPEKEIKSVELPKFLLKSRILRFDYPPMLHYCTYVDLPEIFIDNGILSDASKCQIQHLILGEEVLIMFNFLIPSSIYSFSCFLSQNS
uniref:Uncharacterized protein n=1 Tax=Cacopsylla melanoneura TaxID=428564 RepID=A0A8D9F2A6_9HEMI